MKKEYKKISKVLFCSVIVCLFYTQTRAGLCCGKCSTKVKELDGYQNWVDEDGQEMREIEETDKSDKTEDTIIPEDNFNFNKLTYPAFIEIKLNENNPQIMILLNQLIAGNFDEQICFEKIKVNSIVLLAITDYLKAKNIVIPNLDRYFSVVQK